METPGDYSQSSLYRTHLNYFSSGASVGVRLRREDHEFLGGSAIMSTVNARIFNDGEAGVVVILKGSNVTDPEGLDSEGSPSGTRYNLSSNLSINPGGYVNSSVSAIYPFLEFWGVSGISSVRAEITSRIKWEKSTVILEG